MILTYQLLFIVQLCLILSNFLSSISAHFDSVQLYNIVNNRYISLEPSSTKVLLKLSGNLYIKPDETDPGTFIFGIPVFKGNVEFADKNINLLECESIKKYKGSMEKAYAVSYDKYGLFLRYLGAKDDIDVNYNLKVILAYFIQNQNNTLFPSDEKEFTLQTTEPTVYGNCSVTYHVTRWPLPGGAEEVIVKKTFENFKKCLERNNRNVLMGDPEYFSSHCASTSEEEYEWETDIHMQIERSPTVSVLHSVNITENISYKPYKNSTTVVKMFHNLYGFLKRAPQEFKVVTVDKENAAVFKELKLTNFNKDILNDSDVNSSKDVQLLKDFYKALSCSSVDHSDAIKTLEAAILCNS